jgi:hypothetical protein
VIPAKFELGANGVTEMEEEAALARPGRAAVGVIVMGLALALPVLPAVLGLGLAPAPVREAAEAALGSLVAIVGGVKLAAAAWGLIARLTAGHGSQFAAASVD